VPRKKKLTAATVPASGADIGKAKLLTLADIDGRTTSARRANALVAELESDLGGGDHLSAGQRVLVRRVAAAVAVSEHLETLWLAGHGIDVSALTTLQNTVARTLNLLGLERVSKDVTPSIEQFAAELAAEKAAITTAEHAQFCAPTALPPPPLPPTPAST
jgi:hypothetical protein